MDMMYFYTLWTLNLMDHSSWQKLITFPHFVRESRDNVTSMMEWYLNKDVNKINELYALGEHCRGWRNKYKIYGLVRGAAAKCIEK